MGGGATWGEAAKGRGCLAFSPQPGWGTPGSSHHHPLRSPSECTALCPPGLPVLLLSLWRGCPFPEDCFVGGQQLVRGTPTGQAKKKSVLMLPAPPPHLKTLPHPPSR